MNALQDALQQFSSHRAISAVLHDWVNEMQNFKSLNNVIEAADSAIRTIKNTFPTGSFGYDTHPLESLRNMLLGPWRGILLEDAASLEVSCSPRLMAA